MSKHDEGRRAFLVGTAIGAGAAASAALVPEALAKTSGHDGAMHALAANDAVTAPSSTTTTHAPSPHSPSA